MKSFTRIFGVAALALAATLMSGQKVEAGRIGGPAAVTVTLAPYQVESVDVPFAGDLPAVVTVDGPGAINVELYVRDGDGNVTQPVLVNGRKTVIINVYREGLFRVEVRNVTPRESTITVSTN